MPLKGNRDRDRIRPPIAAMMSVHEDRHLQRQRHQRRACRACSQWLDESKPDVACLQELKAPDDEVPGRRRSARRATARVWHGQKAWNGVAILARGREPIESRRGLPGDRRRHAQPLPRGRGATASSSAASTCPTATRSRARSSTTSWPGSSASSRTPRPLVEQRPPVVLAGDYNVVPTDARHLQARARGATTRCCSPRAASAYRRLLAQGWTDAIRRAASRTRRSTPSGTTSGSAGRATRACASTTCC